MAIQITRVGLLGFLLGALGTTACAKKAPLPDPKSASDADACTAAAQAASSSVLDVVAAHRACTDDSECVVVEINASCFDACTRAVAQSGVDAVSAARAAAETGSCATFAADGCKLIVPPCAPPAAPSCVAGACQ